MITLEQHQSNLAERAFAHYDFGNGVEVTDVGGWVYVSPSNERTRKVYYECEPEDDGPAPRGTLTFTARFAQSGRSLEEAYAIDEKGQIWGCMPGRENAEPNEIPGEGEYQSFLYDTRPILASSSEMKGLINSRPRNGATETSSTTLTAPTPK